MAFKKAGEYRYIFSGDAGKLDKTLNSVERRVRKSSSLIKKIGAGLAGAAVAGGLTFATKKALEFSDAIAKTADRVGISTDEYQKYAFAASQAGVKQEILNVSLTAFARRVGALRQGTGPLIQFLAKFDQGLIKTIGDTKNQEEALNLFFKELRKIDDMRERINLADAAFSEAGRKAILMADNIFTLKQRAEALGIVIDEDILRNAEDATDQLDIMSKVIRAQAVTALAALFPVIVDVGNAFIKAIPAIRGFAQEFKSFANKTDLDVINQKIKEQGDLLTEAEEKLKILRVKQDFGLRKGFTEFFFGETSQEIEKEIAERKKNLEDLQLAADNVFLARSVSGGEDTGKIPPLLQEYLDKLNAQAGATNKAKTAAKGLSDEQKRLNKLMAEGASITQSLRTPLEIYEDRLFNANDLLQESAITWETYNREIAAAQKELDEVAKEINKASKAANVFADQAARNMQDSLADFFKSAGRGVDDFRISFLNAIRDIAAEIAASKIFNLIGQSSSSGSVAGLLGSAFAGFLAGGGDINRGQFAVVGEQGPELFVPKTSGTVIPNNAMGGVTYNIDARGAQRGVSQEIMRALKMTEERSVSRSTAAVKQDIKDGGDLAKLIGLRA